MKTQIKLIEGKDKQFSTLMVWEVVGLGFTIRRRHYGNVNSSSYLHQPVWMAFDQRGIAQHIPGNIRRHEKSIANYLVETFGGKA